MSRRKSIIWEISSSEFADLVGSSASFSDVLKNIGLDTVSGGNFRTLKKRISEDGVDVSHIYANIKKRPVGKMITLEEVLVENSTYSRNHLKNRLLKEGLLENKCAICGMKPEWQGKKLVLVLDHINGINNDHRLENLRLLCPNCNSQTDTFAGKKCKKKTVCVGCGKEVRNSSIRCKPCAAVDLGYRNRKVKNRPGRKFLLSDVDSLGYVGTGKKYGVSDTTIRNWLRV